MILRPAARSAHALFVLGLVVGGVVITQPDRARTDDAQPRVDGRQSAAALSALPQHRMSYRGISVEAPEAWPVVDLDADPSACVRMDRPAVYLGTPGATPSCPARAFASADSIWLSPTSAGDKAAVGAPSATTARPAGRTVHTRWNAASRSGVAVVPDAGVSIRTTSPSGRLTTMSVVDTLGPATGSEPGTPATRPSTTRPTTLRSTNPAPGTTGTAPAAYVQSAAATPTGKALNGMWFDTCSAPTTGTMSAWKSSSPYAAVGVYIGGALRGCGQPNLNATWVRTVTAQGWGIAPIYVGLQAPCVQASLSTFTASNAASTGTASAVDAAADARSLGLAAGSAIQYDMENYATGDASCTNAVLAFVGAWTTEIRRQGFTAGIYGNVGSLMSDMSRAVRAGSTSFVAPDQVWYALWDGLQTTSTGSSTFLDSYWTGRRLHQYRGDFTETWGGVSMQIDASWSTAVLPGNPTQVGYGAGQLGPGSAGFVFTGDMSYWRPSPGSGVAGLGYWTHTAGSSTEANGATWSPSLSPGTYAVDVNVPGSIGANGIAHYTVTDASGSHPITVDQSTSSGFRTLGSTFVVRAGYPLRLHLADNQPTSTTGVIAADAARFRLVQGGPPGPATSVRATPGDGRAAVQWTAAAANGAAITSYRVVASPGGAAVTVSGSATQATVTGLHNGTGYTFVVTATSSAGTGTASVASPAVVPTPPDASFPRDVTGDRKADVVAVVASTGALRTYPGSGTGGWQPTRVTAASGWSGYRAVLTAGNWDADRVSDVLTISSQGILSLRHGNGDGSFAAPVTIGHGWLVHDKVFAAGDFDGDGHPDLLARRASDGALFLYSGNGYGGFRGTRQVGWGWKAATALLGAGDFTGDGHPDVLFRRADGALVLYPGDGRGGWLAARTVGSGWQGFTALVAPGDFNGDGHVDVLARSADGRLWLYPGNGRGAWLPRRQVGNGWQMFSTILP